METERRKILVIGKPDSFDDALCSYAIQLAQRLKYDIYVVGIMPQTADSTASVSVSPASRYHHVLEILDGYKQKAARKEVHCDHAIHYGDVADVVHDAMRTIKRIEFVVTNSEDTKAQLSEDVTIPVFSLTTHQHQPEEKPMSRDSQLQRKNEIKKTIGFGLLTAALYGCVFWNADKVMSYFTKGGFYAALPVATVFIFSFAHGTFASNFWSLLGIKPMKKDALQPSVTKTVTQTKTKRVQKRPRAYAYVNPFHKI